MTYRTNDGQVLVSTDPEALVEELRSFSLSPGSDTGTFMREVKGRVLLQTGERIRYQDKEEFVNELVRVGLLVDADAPEDPGYDEKEQDPVTG